VSSAYTTPCSEHAGAVAALGVAVGERMSASGPHATTLAATLSTAAIVAPELALEAPSARVHMLFVNGRLEAVPKRQSGVRTAG
jgi:energy-converting hydrogenase Eha subunit B